MLNGIEYQIIVHEEHVPVRGNAIASGNNEYDKKIEDEILSDLEWNLWAWCCVEVKATWKGLTTSDYLGGCSYEDEESFKTGGYYEDMKNEARSQLEKIAEEIAEEMQCTSNPNDAALTGL